jgi:uncharacterized protein
VTRVTGYPIVFGSNSIDLGGFTEIVTPGAVDRTLRGSDDVVLLRNHDDSMALARRSARSLILTKETDGLAIDAAIDEHVTFAGDLLRMIERGDARGGSFGFIAVGDDWTIKGGKPFRQLLDIVIREISVGVTFPAYPGTRLHLVERGTSDDTAQQRRRTGTHSKAFYDARLKLLR